MHWQILYHYSFLLIFAVFATNGADPNPVITYKCTTEKKIASITVTGVSYDNIKVVKDDGNYCERIHDGQTGLLECIQQQVTTADKIQLIYEGEKNAKLDAGTNVLHYGLSCDEKSEIKNATVKLESLFGATAAPHWTTLNAMSQSGDPTLTIAPRTGLTVGQELTLTMKIPNTEYLLSPRECYAHHTGDTDNIKIWECIKTVVDPNIIDKSVWNQDSGVTDGTSVSIKMFAFKFVDSADLVIDCFAMVCKKPSTQCTLSTCATTTTTIAPVTVAGRKRRNVNTTNGKMNTTIRHASLLLEVRDLPINKSAGLATTWYAYLVPAYLLMFARLYL